ncbi:hypothetical protein LTR53_009410 [Teratosphaeriaceae sp. CCFEE 6253]|nr:hypothetical protein LTR53_009410 [Teratosphaeriaceae sp. CCFEE 6253]
MDEMSSHGHVGGTQFSHAFICLPNGEVRSPWQRGDGYYSTWDPAQFLQITLGVGELSFPAAKAIDIAWDLVVGRGGQALLAWMCSPLFRSSLTRAMEAATVPTPVYAAVTFDKISLTSISTLASTLIRRDPRRLPRDSGGGAVSGRWRYALLALAFGYILAFPTWTAAVTGYQSRDVAYAIRPSDGSLVPTAGMDLPAFVLADGARAGLQDYWPIFFDHSQTGYVALADELRLVFIECVNHRAVAYPNSSDIAAAQDLAQSSGTLDANSSTFEYAPTRHCSFTLPMNATSLSQILGSSVTFAGARHDIPAPTLDIVQSAAYLYNDATWYALGNLSLRQDYLATHVRCEPAATYQWGFASIPLCAFAALSLAFAGALLALQQDVFHQGRASRHQSSRGPDTYRDALDLARELRDQFGPGVEDLPGGPLRRLVERESAGVGFEAAALGPSRWEERRVARARRRRGGRGARGAGSGTVGWLVVAGGYARAASEAETSREALRVEAQEAAMEALELRPIVAG